MLMILHSLTLCDCVQFVILVGTCFVAYFIGNVSSLVMEGDRTDTYLRDMLDDATAFCEQKMLPPDLTRAILTHLNYHVQNNYVFEEEEILSAMPPNIQSQIHQTLAQVPYSINSNLSIDCTQMSISHDPGTHSI